MAKRDAEKREGGVGQVQLYPGGKDDLARVWVPPVGSEDGEVRRAREIFEGFSAEMRAALEGGSLEEVNRVLAEMEVSEAEKTADLLNEVSPSDFFEVVARETPPLIFDAV
jgi:cell division cycle protein 37